MRLFCHKNAAIFLFTFLLGCSNPDKNPPKLASMIMTTELINDSAAIKQYEFYHSKAGVWPEIGEANKVSGISEVKIYRYGNRLVLLMTYPENTDRHKMDSLYTSVGEKVTLWGKIMSNYQRSLPGVDTTQKWVEMKLIHDYSDGKFH